jgi:hypothetical protein
MSHRSLKLLFGSELMYEGKMVNLSMCLEGM